MSKAPKSPNSQAAQPANGQPPAGYTKTAVAVTNAMFSAMEERVPLHVTSAIIDREAGASFVDNIWSQDVNVDFTADRLRRRVATDGGEDTTVREIVAKALMSNGMAKVFLKAIDSNTYRQGGMMSTKTELSAAVEAAGYTGDVGVVMTELAAAPLIANKVISDSARFGVRRKVGHEFVSIAALCDDLLKQEISKAINEAKRVFMIPNGTHSVRALAEQFGEAFRSVGRHLAMINDYENVIHDITLGVLANIDPVPNEAQRGSVSNFLKNHAVVESLSTNWNFIIAALDMRAEALGAKGVSNGVGMRSAEWLFDKHAPVILAMLRSSDRYAIVSKSEYVASVGVKKVHDLQGRPKTSVIYDNVRMEPTAMVVTATTDVLMEGALSLDEMPERVSERMASAYGELHDGLHVAKAAQLLVDVLTTAVEDGVTVDQAYSCRLATSSKILDLDTMAAMLASSVSASFSPYGGANGEPTYTLIYSGPTEYKHLELKQGQIHAGTFFTSSAAEFFLASNEFSTRQEMTVPPQLIPRHAMNCRLLGFDDSDFVRAKERAGYKFDALGVNISGVFRLRSLTSIRLGDLATMVVPHHNSQVFRLVNDIVTDAWTIANGIGTPAAKRRARRYVGFFVREASQNLAAGFRSEIHDAVIERAVEKLSFDESVKMRAKLRQQAVLVFADALALSVFVKLQGIAAAESEMFVDVLMRESDIIEYWTELGSDRLAV